VVSLIHQIDEIECLKMTLIEVLLSALSVEYPDGGANGRQDCNAFR